jgi:hypothetical protein
MYLLDYVNYGLIGKYTTQEFIWNMQELASNKKLRELLLNPLKNKENKSRLLKLFKQFKIKSDRKGPSISATLFKNNTYLIGNDNSLWKIENKRWTKVETITERIKFNKNLIPNLEKMSAIGSYNMNGVCYNIINGGKNSPTFVTFYKIFDK